MKTNRKPRSWWFVWSLTLSGALLLPSGLTLAQEERPPSETPAAAARADAQPAPDTNGAKADSEAKQEIGPAAEASNEAAKNEPVVTADTSKEPAKPEDDGAGVAKEELSLPAGASEPSLATEALESAGATPSEATRWSTFGLAVTVLALFILPVVIGNYLSRQWKMPDHGWKFSVILFALAASLLIVTFGEFKFGPDLAGGITLVYELAEVPTETATEDATRPDENGETQIRAGGREFSVRDLIGALKKRLDPDGTKEITIREYGPAIEIIIPQTGPDEMEFVKRRITDLGQLEFRITADPAQPEDRPRIERARRLPPGQKVLMDGDVKIAEWVAYDEKEFGPVDEEAGIVKRMAGETPEALVLMDPWNVTGEFLTSATKGLDDAGRPAVHFSFNREGAWRFRQLTSKNRPNPATGAFRLLGIILDKTLISAPRINETISDRGIISGGAMSDKEVEHIVEILNAGSLPAALNKTPISEAIISPTLGKVTVEKGKTAIIWSMVAVVGFMLIYYRFAGLVAFFALSFNLLLVVALMVLIKAAFTLPGLAGLVLTIGMSVDANVLIYERIREELRSGAALRMAIRNGFSRAMSAIIDSNVTTIISGLALFYIGTDQVKGFAVTLILGILTSMFTAIFFARVVFDVVERRGWVRQIRMMQMFSQPNFDFLSVRWLAGGASIALILIGMVAVYARGKDLLDIDFTGGSSVSFTLHESGKMPIAEVRNALIQTELADKNLLVVERGTTNTRYSIDTSEQSVEAVKKVIVEQFGDRLLTYSLDVSNLQPYKEGDFTGTEATLRINTGPDYTDEDGLSYDALHDWLRRALVAEGQQGIQPALSNPNYRRGSAARFKEWTVRLIGLEPEATRAVFDRLQKDMQNTPLFPMATTIGGRVSADMQTKALLAIGVSLLGIIGYLWIRFQKVTYGLAASVALVHDVLITIGMMALSAYLVQLVPGVAELLKIESFQISLTIVAALLTIIGYSLNDTIVTFDRLREVKGKTPYLTGDMVNASVNQTLSRTILTALTSLFVVVILYFFGGEGIHSFAFAFMVGIIVGTYSTVYIAAPVLLWLSGASRSTTVTARATPRVAEAVR
jgi:SecD/SecF fusion protein